MIFYNTIVGLAPGVGAPQPNGRHSDVGQMA